MSMKVAHNEQGQGDDIVKIRTNVKAGRKSGDLSNHNEALVVKSRVKAGEVSGTHVNHNESLGVKSPRRIDGAPASDVEALVVKSCVKAGSTLNHNETLAL